MILWRTWKVYRWHYTWPAIWWHRISFWCRIVGRTDESNFWIGPGLAWYVACTVHSKDDHWGAA